MYILSHNKILFVFVVRRTMSRRSPTAPSCINQTRNGTMSPFWEWTSKATFEGDKKIRERLYDLYSYAVSQVCSTVYTASTPMN